MDQLGVQLFSFLMSVRAKLINMITHTALATHLLVKPFVTGRRKLALRETEALKELFSDRH